ncbi:hypothetical protein ACG93T_17445 [Acinetobacter beijerinckii]|uniref:hypothetical protein n=1 Tax=Acinetobacter beijerinckii TaxID=262668 RepID=UPI003AF7805F
MGVKKLVRITVEAEIEIELPEWAANPTEKDIEDVNYCGFEVKDSDDIYKEAGRLILMGYAECNNDVFGVFHQSWRKGLVKNSDRESFYELVDLYVEDFTVEES